MRGLGAVTHTHTHTHTHTRFNRYICAPPRESNQNRFGLKVPENISEEEEEVKDQGNGDAKQEEEEEEEEIMV